MYKKKGFPEVDEFVICTIKDVQQHSILLDLDEYENKQGMLYTSEIHRKQVRALKVFFKPGQKIVCKVISVNPKANQINLSLRRVGAGQERSKQKEWGNEKRANDLLQTFAKQNKLSPGEVYDKIGYKLIDEYGAIFPVFLSVAKGDASLLKDIDKKLADKLIMLIQKRIIIPKAEISGTLIISSKAPDGIEIIKKAAEAALDIAKKEKAELSLKYISAPRYKLNLKCAEIKKCESILASIVSAVEKVAGKSGEVEFKRI